MPLLVAVVAAAERKGAFGKDRFATPARKWTALGLFFLLLACTVLAPAASDGRNVDTSTLRFGMIFEIQGLLVAFLALWWLLAGRPDVLDFLGLRSARPLTEVGVGICLGLIGWAVTVALLIVFAVLAIGLFHLKLPTSPPPVVTWLSGLAAWQRGLVVLSAMTVEEFYFRAFLQRRIGPWAASLLFLLAHAGYGEPLSVIGIAAITAVLATAFHLTRSTVAPIVAHGVFDGVQLFVVIPLVLKASGQG